MMQRIRALLARWAMSGAVLPLILVAHLGTPSPAGAVASKFALCAKSHACVAFSLANVPTVGHLALPSKRIGTIQPATHWVSATCFQDRAYMIPYWMAGQGWTAFLPDPQGTSVLTTTLSYFWCPRWAGDPVGFNFSGMLYQPHECLTISSGWQPDIEQGVGVSMVGSAGQWFDDGLYNDQQVRCPGQHIWDFSELASGDQNYLARAILLVSGSGWSMWHSWQAPYAR